MRYVPRLNLAVLVLGGFLAGFLADGTTRADEPIRILLTVGGHVFEEEPFFAMFDAMEDIDYTVANIPEDLAKLEVGLADEFDCIVSYDMCKTDLTPEQKETVVAMFQRGIGLVSMHHNVGAHRNWDEFPEIIGGKYIFEDCTIDGRQCTKTPWSHDEDLEIHVVDKGHPITQGVSDFAIHDETYGRFYVAPDTHVLLTTDHPKNNREIAWTTQYAGSRVFYLMLGHDGKAYANPSYRKLLHQGIRWAAQ